MWRTGLLYLDRGDSAIIAALRDSGYNNNQQSPASPTRRMSLSSDTGSVRSDSRTRIPKQAAMQQWMVPGADVSSIKFPQQVKVEDPAESLSPLSDTTLFEEPAPYSLDQIKEDDAPPGYFSSQYETMEKDPSPKIQREELQSQKQRPRHQRAPSTPTTPIFNAQRSSRILPSRAKTSEGLLQLQANSAKAPRPAQGHQRKVSLGLPIRSPTAPAEEIKQTVVSRPAVRSTETSPAIRPSRRSGSISLVQQERELEYIHRHTFVGTASLDDFLEVLDVSPQQTTTKTAVVNAFLLLASSERQLARQASLKPAGWGLVSKTTNETVNIDYVEQAHAKLGSIVLRQFLDLIPFDEDDEASAMSVVEAFSASSYIDAKTESSISSKARAFRSWMVRHAA